MRRRDRPGALFCLSLEQTAKKPLYGRGIFPVLGVYFLYILVYNTLILCKKPTKPGGGHHDTY